MKIYIALVLATAVIANAQAPAADPLAPIIKKYRTAADGFASSRKSALKSEADSYLRELLAASKVAVKAGSTLAIAAIERERDAVLSAGELPRDPAADLPKQVHSARRKYVKAAARVNKSLGWREEAAKKQFISGLDAAERKAKADRDEALLARIAAERVKLAGEPDPSAGFGKNLLVNADFTAGAIGPGAPPKWDDHKGMASVEKEDGKAFLHITGKAVSQLVKLPPGTEKIHVALRLRAPDFKASATAGSHKAGVHLYLEDAANKLIDSDDIEITRAEKKWKSLEHETEVPEGVSQVRLMIFREGIEGALDADSVRLEALGK